jgi:hypothetical protein
LDKWSFRKDICFSSSGKLAAANVRWLWVRMPQG